MSDQEAQVRERVTPAGSGTNGIVDPEVGARLQWAFAVLMRRKWVLIGLPLLAGIIAAVFSLQMQNLYRAETRVLIPESGGGIGSLLETVAPGASALLGKSGGSYTRYLAILTSRSAFDEVIEEFDLVEHYDLSQEKLPLEQAREIVSDRVTFEVSLEYDYLSVMVLDADPDLAARMANFFVKRLNDRHITMNSSAAAENRRLLETRLHEADAALDSAQADMQSFQERFGVVELESQAAALMTAIGDAQGQVARAEAQVEMLRAQYGDENPDVASARAALESARSSLDDLQGGRESVLPIAIQNIPSVGRQYATIFQELRTQEEILKGVRPLYEQAVITERLEGSAVQVLDEAIPPRRKAAPRRSLIVLSVIAAVGIVSALTLLLLAARAQRGQLPPDGGGREALAPVA